MTEILVILALVLLNGVFAGAEIAVLSMRKTRLAELVEEGSSAARAVLRLREDPEAFLATVQIGITVVGATAAAFGGASLAEDLAPVLAAVPALAGVADKLALGIVVALVSTLSLVLGELVPKSLALRAGEPYALLIGRPLAALSWTARPVVALLTGVSNLVLRLFGDRTTFTEARLSRDEIQQLVEEATSAGSVDPHAGEIASRALQFSGLDAYTVMVPRAAIAMAPKSADPALLAKVALESRHGRLPVYDANLDDIVGHVNVRDALAASILNPTTWTLAEFLHPVIFVPDAMPAPTLLRKMQTDRVSIALVIDEQGTLVGLVSMEDLVEELVGEIMGENDAPREGLVRQPDGTWLVAGDFPLHELDRALGIELPEGDFSTVAGLCIAQAGHIPQAGARVEFDGATFEVVEATPRRVRVLRLRRIVPPEGSRPRPENG
ncbi:MAG: hemolysin family protein [Pseudomonadota bacterium]|nr:hemolysin family protein [Pseudomonadota bacterium]